MRIGLGLSGPSNLKPKQKPRLSQKHAELRRDAKPRGRRMRSEHLWENRPSSLCPKASEIASRHPQKRVASTVPVSVQQKGGLGGNGRRRYPILPPSQDDDLALGHDRVDDETACLQERFQQFAKASDAFRLGVEEGNFVGHLAQKELPAARPPGSRPPVHRVTGGGCGQAAMSKSSTWTRSSTIRLRRQSVRPSVSRQISATAGSSGSMREKKCASGRSKLATSSSDSKR